MRPHLSIPGRGPTVYLDATPLSGRPLTGIGRFTARIGMALADRGARVRFFADDRELIPPSELEWSPDQDLNRWAARIRDESRPVPLADVPEDAVGLWMATGPRERRFSVELSVLHDLSPLIIPGAHDPQTRAAFEFFYARSLPSSDAALAVSHSTKADAGWLSDYSQDRIAVVHPGPSQCLLRHLHERRVARRSNVGILVSTPEPRENAEFVIDWFRSSRLLPARTELWWVNRNGQSVSSRLIEDLQRSHKGRRIRLLNVDSDEQLCELFQTAGWSVHASLYDGFAFPVLDSLRHGVPVLSTCNSSLREFAHPGVHFFDPHDADTLDRAWAQCRAAGPNLVSKAQLDEHYNWDRVARAILDMTRDARSVQNAGALTRDVLIV